MEKGVCHMDWLNLAGCHVVAVDNTDRPYFTSHPNVKYVKADATKFDLTPFDFVFASPPCQKFSTMKHAAGAHIKSKELNLIPDVRNLCLRYKKPYCIENVVGAGSELRDPIGLCGTMFGLGVSRHRLFECSFKFEHDIECKHEGYCLGIRSRMPKVDKHMNKKLCCSGNLWGVYGSTGRKTGGVNDWSEAMNIHHMSAKGLSLSLPYSYGQYMGAVAIMHLVKERLSKMNGEMSMQLTNCVLASTVWDTDKWWKLLSNENRSPEDKVERLEKRTVDIVKAEEEHEEYDKKWDELHYSVAGPIGCVMGCRPSQLERLPPCSDEDIANGLFSTIWICKSKAGCRKAMKNIEKRCEENINERHCIWVQEWSLDVKPSQWKVEKIDGWCGKWLLNRWVPALPKLAVDVWPEEIKVVEIPEEEKRRRYLEKWNPVNLNVEQFKLMNFSEEIVQWLEEGVPIMYLGDREKVEVIDQYDFKDKQCKDACVLECARAVACGALVLPAEDVKVTKTHSWVVVIKGGRTRVCLDCSKLINDMVPSLPFNLPQFTDVAKMVKPGSYMAKYDLRDFFWNLKVKRGDTGLMGVVHPGDNKTYVHERLCFGYKDSPRLACKLSEAVAVKLRGLGVNCLVFVDDFIICEDDYETCVNSMLIMEAVLLDLGFEISTHKTEGPAQLITFLGVEIDAREDQMYFRLPADKMLKIKGQLEQLKQWEIDGITEVAAKDLAAIVGMLCFAARIVNGGQIFMRSMWDSLSVAHVDRLGRPWVKWGALPIKLCAGVFDEAKVWSSIIKSRNNFPIHHKELVPLQINMASDSSMKGGGGVVKFNLAPEEVAVVWSEYEKEQHINWLEMLMVWVMLFSFKSDLAGKVVKFEVDNLVTCWCLRRAGARTKQLMMLVRWVWLLCLQYDIALDMQHLAGTLNVRPDALSRGVRPMIPKIRLKSCWVRFIIESLPTWVFDLCVGREQKDFNLNEGDSETKLDGHTAFIHPRFDHIGQCLWWIFEAVERCPTTTRGIVVLPRNEDAVWWPLVKRFVILRCLPAAVTPLLHARPNHDWVELSSKYDVLLCAFPVLPVLSPVKVEPATLVAGIPVDLNTGVSPMSQATSSEASRLYDGKEFKVGSFVYHIFGESEMKARHLTVTTKTGRVRKEYGDLYQVLEVYDTYLVCKFWAKASPSGAYDRVLNFVLTEEALSSGDEGWRIHLLNNMRDLMDVTTLVDTSKMNCRRETDRKVLFDARAMVAQMWGMGGHEEELDQYCGNAADRIATAQAEAQVVDNDRLARREEASSGLQQREWWSPGEETATPSSNATIASSLPKPPTLKPDSASPTQYSTPVARSRLAPAREIGFQASRGKLRLGNITSCWDGLCDSEVSKDISCSGCGKKAHSKCYGVKLFTLEEEDYSTKCPTCLCEEFSDVIEVDGELSPQLIRDMVSWSLDACGSNRKKSVEDTVSNMISATRRFELKRSLKQGACLKRVQLFGAMLEFVAMEEGHPASVLKHMTALKHWFDKGKNGGIERECADFSRDTILSDKAATLVAAMYRGKEPGDELPWDLVQCAYRLMRYSKSSLKIKSRLEVISDLLLLAGYRVGETCLTDSAHGLHSGGFIVRMWEDSSVTWCPTGVLDDVNTLHAVDVVIDDYKMHNHRGLVSVMSPVESCDNSDGGWGLNLYRSMVRMCEAYGMEWHYTVMEGNRVKMINYYVIRFDLQGFSTSNPDGKVLWTLIQEAIRLLPDMDDEQYYNFTIAWIKKRWESENQRIKFFNIAGGTLEEVDAMYEQLVLFMFKWMNDLRDGGHGGRKEFDPDGVTKTEDAKEEGDKLWNHMIYNMIDEVVTTRNGPLLRTTHGKYNTHMPLSYSTATSVVDYWKQAELETKGVASLKIVSHSGRHTATARARTKILLTDCDPTLYDEVIDGHMRWQPDEGKLRKDYTGHLALHTRLCPTKHM